MREEIDEIIEWVKSVRNSNEDKVFYGCIGACAVAVLFLSGLGRYKKYQEHLDIKSSFALECGGFTSSDTEEVIIVNPIKETVTRFHVIVAPYTGLSFKNKSETSPISYGGTTTERQFVIIDKELVQFGKERTRTYLEGTPSTLRSPDSKDTFRINLTTGTYNNDSYTSARTYINAYSSSRDGWCKKGLSPYYEQTYGQGRYLRYLR